MFTGGTIRTGAAGAQAEDALAVTGGRITALGGLARRSAGPSTVVVDLARVG